MFFVKLNKSFLVLLLVFSMPFVHSAQSYRVNVGSHSFVEEYSMPKTVENVNCSYDLFVPTNSSAEWASFYNNFPGCSSVSPGNPFYGTNTAVVNYNTDMYGWNFVNESVVSIPNEWTTNIWTGNFWGAWHLPVTVIDSAHFDCGSYYCVKSGTNKFKIHDSRNVNRYMRMRVQGAGGTTSAQIGAIKLYFTDGWSGTIDQAIAAGKIHQVVYIIQTSSSTSWLWNLSNLSSGGYTDTKSYPWVFIAFAPKVPLEYFEFWSNKNFNTTYDGFRPYTTNVYPIWGE